MSRPRGPGERSTLRPDLLLTHAEQLVARVSDTGRPRTAHPRRAVSAAYYAVFHHVIQWVSYYAVPHHHVDAVAELCRAFNHSDLEIVAKWVSGNTPPPSVSGLVATARASTDIGTWADLFLVLKQERELADYSHEIVMDRTFARSIVGQAHEAMAALDSLDPDHSSWLAFVTLVLLKAQPSSRRG